MGAGVTAAGEGDGALELLFFFAARSRSSSSMRCRVGTNIRKVSDSIPWIFCWTPSTMSAMRWPYLGSSL